MLIHYKSATNVQNKGRCKFWYEFMSKLGRK